MALPTFHLRARIATPDPDSKINLDGYGRWWPAEVALERVEPDHTASGGWSADAEFFICPVLVIPRG